MKTISRRGALALVVAAAVVAGPAVGQTWPTKPIRLVVPFPAGGGTDIVARIVATELSSALGQPVLVDNKGGANGILGADIVAKSMPDGHTLVMSTMGNFAINPAIYKKMPFSVTRDLVPVTQVVTVPLMLVVHPSVPAQTVAEFVAWTKSQPDPVPYASSGTGGGPHLAGELFAAATGARLQHIPYKGSGPAYIDLLGGQVAAHFDSLVQGLQYVRANRLRALALLSPRRSDLLPNVPTMSEAVPGYDVTNWYGIMAPAGTPMAVRTRIQVALSKSLTQPEMRARLMAEGAEPVVSTPDEFGAFLGKELVRWAEAVKKAKIELE